MRNEKINITYFKYDLDIFLTYHSNYNHISHIFHLTKTIVGIVC